MIFSFVIPFHPNRFENLLQTLRFLIENHKEIVSESQIVTVCQSSVEFDQGEKKEQFLGLTNLFCEKKHFDMEEEEMILAKMINRGVANCVSDRVIVLESDRILPSNYFTNLVDKIKPKTSITCRHMKKLKNEVNDEKIKNNQFEYNDEFRSEENHIGSRNMWSGNTAFWKNDFFEADMMDEGYVGYGWADSDMTNKMKEIGVKSIFQDEIELHLWHPPQTYGKTNQKRLFLKNGLRFCKKWGVEHPDWFKQELEEHQSIL
jgi:hypothetical protein